MKFLKKPKPEEKGESIERPQADLSNILASFSMRLEQVEHRLDALEETQARPRVVSPLPPALPQRPEFQRPEGLAPPEAVTPRPSKHVAPRPARPRAKEPKPKPRVVKPPKPSPRAGPPAELRAGVGREKLKPVKLMRGKTTKPFKKGS